jgi:predicted DsbA family dithiol-disulfide isomerase
MARTRKIYDFDEVRMINSYLSPIMHKFDFLELLKNEEDKNKASLAFNNLTTHAYCVCSGSKNPFEFNATDEAELTEWVYKWLSTEGIKRLNSNIRQQKFRQKKNIKTLKVSSQLALNIGHEARESGVSIEVLLADLIDEAFKKRQKKRLAALQKS